MRAVLNADVVAGTQKELTFEVLTKPRHQGGVPIDITPYSINVIIADSPGGTVRLNKTSPTGITKTDPTNGVFVLVIEPEDLPNTVLGTLSEKLLYVQIEAIDADLDPHNIHRGYIKLQKRTVAP